MTDVTLKRHTLEEPLTVDGETVTEIALRKPVAGDLRGASLRTLLAMDVTEMMGLLPKITEPPLTPRQLDGMNLVDFTALSVLTTTFFAKRRQLEAQALTLPDEKG